MSVKLEDVMGMTEKEMEAAENAVYMSEEERTYISKALLEAEKYNIEHPEVYTEEEFDKLIKEKYGI